MFYKNSSYEKFVSSAAVQEIFAELDKVSAAGYEKEICHALSLGAAAGLLGYKSKQRRESVRNFVIGAAVASAGIFINEFIKRKQA